MKREWKPASGPDRFRRGLYTFFWRATPFPFLTTFDAPGGVQACTRRLRSNTPLQALTLLNDPAMVEIAQALAARSCASGQSRPATRTGSSTPSTLPGPAAHSTPSGATIAAAAGPGIRATGRSGGPTRSTGPGRPWPASC